MKSDLTIIPILKVHPDKIITYNHYHWSPSKPKSDNPTDWKPLKTPKTEHLLNSSRTADGKLSKIALRKMSLAIDYLLLLASKKNVYDKYSGKNIQFRVAFITLTLSSKQVHSDNQIKDLCLDSFLIEIRKKYNVTRYVWRAEKQENGNIHFHILIDKFIAWSELRDLWNRIQNKLGYVDSYRQKLKEYHAKGFQFNESLRKTWSYEKQLKAYNESKKTDFHNPNSTDIHSLKKVKNVKAYIKKYVSKGVKGSQGEQKEIPEHLKVKGRIWGCSQNLSNIKGCEIEVDGNTTKVIEAIKEIDIIKSYHDSYFSIYYLDISNFNNRHTKFIYDKFRRYLTDFFGIPYDYELNLTG